MTLSQLRAFVFVARLGSVKAASRTLGVSEPAVSQALAALRRHYGDPLVVHAGEGMTLTSGGRRLLGIAAQIIALGAEAEAAVRHGHTDHLHLVATSVIAEFVLAPLASAFGRRKAVEISGGAAIGEEIPLLVASRLADVALGPQVSAPDLVSEPVLRCRVLAVGATQGRRDVWLVDPSATDPASDSSRLLGLLRVPESRIRVFANQTAALNAAAEGAGVAPVTGHLVAQQLRRGELSVVETAATPMETTWYATCLEPGKRSAAAGALLRFLTTPAATQLMRSPETGVPRARFRPTVRVSIWS